MNLKEQQARFILGRQRIQTSQFSGSHSLRDDVPTEGVSRGEGSLKLRESDVHFLLLRVCFGAGFHGVPKRIEAASGVFVAVST